MKGWRGWQWVICGDKVRGCTRRLGPHRTASEVQETLKEHNSAVRAIVSVPLHVRMMYVTLSRKGVHVFQLKQADTPVAIST